MQPTTNSLVARMKHLTIPAGAIATVLFSLAFAFDHSRAHAAAAAAPMDDSSVSSLVSLDNAVEAVAARVTPAVVNVAVTSRVSQDEETAQGGQGFGGMDPQDLPPGLRQFFFGPQGRGQGNGQGRGMNQPQQVEHGVGRHHHLA
jgi:serine protease Do